MTVDAGTDSPEHYPSRLTGRVLVVDAGAVSRRLLAQLLRSRGHQVLEAEDGERALQIVHAEQPDVVLLDVLLPGLDGLEVCRQLKANPDTAAIPVLFLTSIDQRDIRIAGMRAGANDFIGCPVDGTDLLLRIRNAVFTRRLFARQEEQYRRLQELEQLRDSLVHLIIHDLRSPLAGVQTYLELLRLLAQGRQDAEEVHSLQQALDALGSVRELMNTVLDVSRLEAGKMPLHPAPAELRALVTNARQALGTVAVGERVEVRGEGVTVCCDASLVRRVVVNLMSNALKFSPAEAPVVVSIDDDVSGAIVRVTDRGPGIDPEDRSRIFEKFGQALARPYQPGHGTGLGLAFCKMAVEAHGGRIGFDTEVGQGTTFWFTLPLQPAASTAL